MKLKSLEIQGFKSFDDVQSIDFTGAPGLYFLTGENQVSPELGANGAGKTTVLDALCWLLFDKTSRGVKAKGIKNWNGSKKVKVSATLTGKSQKEFTVVRTWSPNSFTWDLNGSFETAKQEDLISEIGLSFESFHQTVLIPQFSEMFFDMLPSAQAKVFSDILDLDKWDVYATNAKESANFFREILQDLKSSIDTTTGSIHELSNVDTSASHDLWEQDKKAEIKVKRNLVAQAKASLSDAESDALSDDDLSTKYDAEIGELDLDIADVDAEIAEEVEDLERSTKLPLAKLESLIADVGAERRAVNRKISDLKALRGECSECFQPITSEHKDSEIRKCDEALTELDAKEASLLAEKNALLSLICIKKKDIDDLKAEKRDIESERSLLLGKRQALAAEKRVRLHAVSTAKKYLREALKALKDTEDSVNPFDLLMQKNKEQKAHLESLLKNYRAEFASASTDLESADFWAKQFKSIKLFIISEVLAQLEVEVNNNLSLLGLEGWEIVFDVARETASKTIKKEFNIFIKSPSNEELVPWESWSGGESQRLRIAGAAGLSSLLLARNGVDLDIEFWDEPTNGMNDGGVRALLAVLKERARHTGRHVWLIDHRSLNNGSFEKVAVVVKDSSGSWIDFDE